MAEKEPHTLKELEQQLCSALSTGYSGDAYDIAIIKRKFKKYRQYRSGKQKGLLALLERVSKNLHDVCTEADDEDHWHLMADVDDLLKELRNKKCD